MASQHHFNIKSAPQIPMILPGTFWCLTTYFNPRGLKNKLKNYHLFRRNLARQGAKLLAIECGLKKQPFELTRTDADKLVQVRSNSVLWHKERLLNIGLKHLPADCDKIAWLDSDIVFVDDNWADNTCLLLQKHKIVKPFSLAARLTPRQSQALFFDEKITKIATSLGGANIIYHQENNLMGYLSVFATAARRQTIESIGFYDKSIISNADYLMSSAFINNPIKPAKSEFSPPLMPDFFDDFLTWKNKAWSEVAGSVGYVPGKLLHLFHGKYRDRRYDTQLDILTEHYYRLGSFLTDNQDGCLEWTEEGKDLEKSLIKSFNRKNEERKLILIFINNWQRLTYTFKRRFLFPLNRQIGLAGLFLKKISPPTYYWLKKIIKKNFNK